MKRAMKYVIPVAIAALAADESAQAADDLFLDLEGIEGESLDPDHKDEIDIVAWSWNLSSPGPVVGDIKVIKRIDRASNDLMLKVLDGQKIPEGTITVRRSGESPLDYLVIEMKDVLVTRVSQGGQPDEGTTETIALSFGEVCLTYTPSDGKGGAGGAETTCWDVEGKLPK